MTIMFAPPTHALTAIAFTLRFIVMMATHAQPMHATITATALTPRLYVMTMIIALPTHALTDIAFIPRFIVMMATHALRMHVTTMATALTLR